MTKVSQKRDKSQRYKKAYNCFMYSNIGLIALVKIKIKSLYEIRVICSRCYCFAPPIEGLFGESSFEKPITAHIPPALVYVG